MVGFSSASLFLGRKLESVTHGGTKGIDHPMRRRTQGAGIVNGWKDKRDRERIPHTYTQNKTNTSAACCEILPK